MADEWVFLEGLDPCLFREVGLSSDPRGTVLILRPLRAPIGVVFLWHQQAATLGPSQPRDSWVTAAPTRILSVVVSYRLGNKSPQSCGLKQHIHHLIVLQVRHATWSPWAKTQVSARQRFFWGLPGGVCFPACPGRWRRLCVSASGPPSILKASLWQCSALSLLSSLPPSSALKDPCD